MAKRINNKFLDEATGEVIELSNAYELEEGDIIRTRAQNVYYQKKLRRSEDKTEFVWLNFRYGTNLEFSVDKVVAVRALYFSTACGRDGIIQKNRLIEAKLSLDKNQKTAFVKQTLESGLLRQEGSIYVVNTEVISWGEYTGKSDHIRIYSNFYRRLCEAAETQAELKRIYYFLQMIPYLNRQTNILAHNQLEQDIERVAYMSFNEFCKVIDFDTAHSAKLKGQLSDFRVNDELVIGFFDDIAELTPKGKNVVLNPKLCFGGDNTTRKYKDICALFENEKNTYLASQTLNEIII